MPEYVVDHLLLFVLLACILSQNKNMYQTFSDPKFIFLFGLFSFFSSLMSNFQLLWSLLSVVLTLAWWSHWIKLFFILLLVITYLFRMEICILFRRITFYFILAFYSPLLTTTVAILSVCSYYSSCFCFVKIFTQLKWSINSL